MSQTAREAVKPPPIPRGLRSAAADRAPTKAPAKGIGYWIWRIWQVESIEEAIGWLPRAPFERGDVTIRPIFEAEDFGQGADAGAARRSRAAAKVAKGGTAISAFPTTRLSGCHALRCIAQGPPSRRARGARPIGAALVTSPGARTHDRSPARAERGLLDRPPWEGQAPTPSTRRATDAP